MVNYGNGNNMTNLKKKLLHKIPKLKGVMALNNQHPKHPKTNWLGEKTNTRNLN